MDEETAMTKYIQSLVEARHWKITERVENGLKEMQKLGTKLPNMDAYVRQVAEEYNKEQWPLFLEEYNILMQSGMEKKAALLMEIGRQLVKWNPEHTNKNTPPAEATGGAEDQA